jgi:hypothetical protein
MFGDGPLSFREFATREPLPLARVHDAVLEFLRNRDDAVLCGAHAVNAYVSEPRMSEDVDLLSPRAESLAEQLRVFLTERFGITAKMQALRKGVGYRVDQTRGAESRHLIDVRSMPHLPPSRRVEEVLVLAPAELIASKVVCMVGRGKSPERFVDWSDLARLLLTFPELKTEEGPVAERLRATGASAKVMAAWKDLVAQEITPEGEDEKF